MVIQQGEGEKKDRCKNFKKEWRRGGICEEKGAPFVKKRVLHPMVNIYLKTKWRGQVGKVARTGRC